MVLKNHDFFYVDILDICWYLVSSNQNSVKWLYIAQQKAEKLNRIHVDTTDSSAMTILIRLCCMVSVVALLMIFYDIETIGFYCYNIEDDCNQVTWFIESYSNHLLSFTAICVALIHQQHVSVNTVSHVIIFGIVRLLYHVALHNRKTTTKH